MSLLQKGHALYDTHRHTAHAPEKFVYEASNVHVYISPSVIVVAGTNSTRAYGDRIRYVGLIPSNPCSSVCTQFAVHYYTVSVISVH